MAILKRQIPKHIVVIVGLLIVVVIGIVSWTAWRHYRHGNTGDKIPAYNPSSDYTKGVSFEATITGDECITSRLPVGDVGCYLTLDDSMTVSVMHGNIMQRQPWGQLLNFPPYPANPTGKRVAVYAHQTGPKEYTLSGSANYYVRIIH